MRFGRKPWPVQTLAVCAAALLWATARAEEAKPRTKLADAPLLDLVLGLNCIQEPELDLEAARREFASLVAQAKTALADKQTPKDKVAALSSTLLANREVTYLSNLYWRDSTLAAGLLRRKGNCLSTSTLFVLAGDALGLPIRLVVVPGHAFARWDDGQTKINIETTQKGIEIPDSVYITRSQATPEDAEALGWGASLGRNAFLAELMLTASYHRIGENRLEDALALLTDVEKLVPNRLDLKLHHITLQADATGKRTEAREQVRALLATKRLSPSVFTGALLWLASEAAAAGDFAHERELLLAAFPQTPKSAERRLLTSLAFCHRSLKDYRAAVRYMELAATLEPEGSPERAADLYNLAILQKNDGRLGDALRSIRAALQINPESWNLQMIEAGYMVLNGERDDGLKRFEKIERPRGDAEFYESMLAWFYAVSKQRDKFYTQFERTLSLSRSPHNLVWIEQDVDLNVYRDEPEFKALVEKHRQRILGEKKTPPAPK